MCLETYPKWLAYDERLEIQVEEFHQRTRSGTSMQMNELEGAAEERGSCGDTANIIKKVSK